MQMQISCFFSAILNRQKPWRSTVFDGGRSDGAENKESNLDGEGIDKIAIHWVVMDDTEDTFDWIPNTRQKV